MDVITENGTKQVASKASAPEKTGEVVTVACKLPNGLQLRLFEMAMTNEAAPGGHREVKMARLVSDIVRINGTATPYGQSPSWPVVGGFALTEGVSKDFMEQWMEQNKDSDLVRNNLIHYHTKLGHVQGEAREKKALLSGLQPLVPDTDKRIPKSKNKNIKLETADEQPTSAA